MRSVVVEPRETWSVAHRALERADELVERGKLVEAVDALTEANRSRRDPELERRLVRVRHEAFAEIDHAGDTSAWPSVSTDTPDIVAGPVVLPGELTADRVRRGILGHGYVHVPGLVPEHWVDRLVEGIDRSLAAAEAFEAGASQAETTPWFEPFKPAASYPAVMKRQVGNRRTWVRESGGVWTADSPRMMFELFDAFEDVGITHLVNSYLGERPAIAVDKCTLRRVGTDSNSDWHQDGAFLGLDIRVLNVWIALSRCGRDAPGLDIVPRRLDHIVETGTDGSIFTWSVGPGAVDRVAADTPVSRPMFEAGDVMLFDELFLHRTAVDPAMSRPRYAVETWLFAPSMYPERYVPLVV
jgi:Phytanoyl-CoA dioxygenase (PhyH)